jgi:hypothetical protein
MLFDDSKDIFKFKIVQILPDKNEFKFYAQMMFCSIQHIQ